MMFYVVFNIASDSTSCSSSFCTFSLSTRHFSWWIPCVCQHLKIVWESSKSDPANFGRITRHTFALHAAPKMHKCDNFRELFDPLPPSDPSPLGSMLDLVLMVEFMRLTALKFSTLTRGGGGSWPIPHLHVKWKFNDAIIFHCVPRFEMDRKIFLFHEL